MAPPVRRSLMGRNGILGAPTRSPASLCNSAQGPRVPLTEGRSGRGSHARGGDGRAPYKPLVPSAGENGGEERGDCEHRQGHREDQAPALLARRSLLAIGLTINFRALTGALSRARWRRDQRSDRRHRLACQLFEELVGRGGPHIWKATESVSWDDDFPRRSLSWRVAALRPSARAGHRIAHGTAGARLLTATTFDVRGSPRSSCCPSGVQRPRC